MEKHSETAKTMGVQIVLISSEFSNYEDCAAWIARQAKFRTFTTPPIIYRRMFNQNYRYFAAERYSMFNKRHVALWKADQRAEREPDERCYLTTIYETSIVPMPTVYPVTA